MCACMNCACFPTVAVAIYVIIVLPLSHIINVASYTPIYSYSSFIAIGVMYAPVRIMNV